LALLRVSGPEARVIVETLCPGGPPWRPRRAQLRQARWIDGARAGEVLDDLVVTWMPGPATATGTDVVELGCHGNPVIIEALLDQCVHGGARPARRGEFTRQAVENGRMDLIQAESLASLIDARSLQGVAGVRGAVEGALGAELLAIRELLLDLAAELEARLDMPGDELGQLTDAQVAEALEGMVQRCRALAATWRAGQRAIRGSRVALVGPVNAGKSSLFNCILGHTRALVSSEAGTTRDVVEASLVIDGLEITLLDTAGQREEATELERAGHALARTLLGDVDLHLLVQPLHQVVRQGASPDGPCLRVGTHVDLAPGSGSLPCDHRVSSTTGEGVVDLVADIRRRLGDGEAAGARLSVASQRQHELLHAVSTHAAGAREALMGALGPAVAAQELTFALVRLAELRGEDVREDVLDRLFARFCIGK
jgi:tRNA modification GTPase